MGSSVALGDIARDIASSETMQPSFTLSEQFAFGSQYSWRLKESEIRFRGSGDFERRVLQRIPASAEQVASFRAALELLHVWDWRNDYDPYDVGLGVCDGSSWAFSAMFGERSCICGGSNGYPSFADPKQTTTDRGRFALLCCAMYDCFGIEGYIDQAKRFAELESRQSGEKGVAQEQE